MYTYMHNTHFIWEQHTHMQSRTTYIQCSTAPHISQFSTVSTTYINTYISQVLLPCTSRPLLGMVGFGPFFPAILCWHSFVLVFLPIKFGALQMCFQELLCLCFKLWYSFRILMCPVVLLFFLLLSSLFLLNCIVYVYELPLSFSLSCTSSLILYIMVWAAPMLILCSLIILFASLNLSTVEVLFVGVKRTLKNSSRFSVG